MLALLAYIMKCKGRSFKIDILKWTVLNMMTSKHL